GTYTSQAAIKRGNRKSELLLREAELWSVMAQNNLQYPAEALDKAWKGVLFNQFHDILPGSSIARVYDEARALYDHILHDVAEVANRAQYALLQEECGRTVFNSLSWAREALVPTGSGYQCVTVPPCGYISVGDVASKPERPVTVTMDAEGAVLENACLRACLNCNGEIISLLDKRTGRQRIGAPANVLHMYKDVPRLFDAWDIDSMYEQSPVALEESGTLEIAEDAGWRAGIRVTRKISNSVWTQVISLDAQSARVDFITTVDWQEKHRLLKACFPTGIHAEEAINEIQFGYMKRPTHRSRPYDADRFEVCNHRYTALCDEGQGAAVLNDCKYGVSMRDDCIGLTLLRAATSPDLHADRGQHTFAYAYYVWNGTWLESDVVREGYAFNVPVTVLPGRGEEASLLRVNAKNIIVETVKAAEDGSGDIILRLYECKHAQTQAT
ncbi:MAG: glycoside hydrolase family 38 C-terminal domain-containing protein, partial [Clostridia bacterium]